MTSGYSEVSDLELGVFKSNISSHADLELMSVHKICAVEFRPVSDIKYGMVHSSSAV